MMRFQRVVPDCVPLSNSKKANSENGRSLSNGFDTTSTGFKTKGFRFKSPSRNQVRQQCGDSAPSPQHSDDNHNQTQRQDNTSSPSASCGGNGEMLFRWGQRKRARGSRSEIQALVDESSSSGNARQPLNKVSRRAECGKLYPPSMPPPPPLQPPPPQQSRANPWRESFALLPHRNLEKRSGAVNGSTSRNSGSSSSRVISRSTIAKRSPPTQDNSDRKMPSSRSTAKDEKPNGSTTQAFLTSAVASALAQSGPEAGFTNKSAPPSEKVKNIAETIEWPRIHIVLSRKEKEEDFFAMKGSKLPQRPKKRAKNIDKALQVTCVLWQYIFPGLWLSDLTKNRYEVREKKCVKKQKRKGLRGMESVDSDSE